MRREGGRWSNDAMNPSICFSFMVYEVGGRKYLYKILLEGLQRRYM